MPLFANDSAAGMMATALAHEIKNPAALAMAYTGIVRQLSDNNEVSEYCGLIQNALMDISDLVQELLFSIHHTPNPCTINISPMLQEMMQEHKASKPNIIFSLDSPPELILYISEQHLRLIISNLIKNATDATGDQNGHVAVYATFAYGCLQVIIRNSIDPLSGRDRHSNGMGIGICQWLLQQLGGEMHFDCSATEYVITVSLPCGI